MAQSERRGDERKLLPCRSGWLTDTGAFIRECIMHVGILPQNRILTITCSGGLTVMCS